MPDYRTQVALLPQRPAFAEGSVEQNWQMPFGFRERGNRDYDSLRLESWLEMLGLPLEFTRKQTEDLSGGERQLAALLRMLQFDPHLLLLDEPTAALDEDTAKLVELLLNQWKRENPERSWIWISHDALQSKRMGDRQFFLEK